MTHAEIIAKELQLDTNRVIDAVKLLDEGNTIPFIARYRKEMTGGMDDEQLRKLHDRLLYLRQLDERKAEVVAAIDAQQKLSPELHEDIMTAETMQRVEDLYRPFRPRRTTRALLARERGLEPLAEWLLSRPAPSPPDDNETVVKQEASRFVNEEKKLPDVDAVLQGARDIIAEILSDDPDLRERLRRLGRQEGVIQCDAVEREDVVDDTGTYDTYASFQSPWKAIRPHQILAINRGEKEEALKVSLTLPEHKAIDILEAVLFQRSIRSEKVDSNGKHGASPADVHLHRAATDSWKRLLAPSIERELRNELTESAERHAIDIFAANLRSLLLLPPLKGHTVIGIDPGYRSGCQVAVVDPTGRLLQSTVIYPTAPKNDTQGAEKTVVQLIGQYDATVIAIGNGTASRETEQFIADVLSRFPGDTPPSYIIVDEAGASIYSASDVARREFPDLDVSERSAVSIARRLQDPMAELVKIDPKSIGVGQYQHDVSETQLSESLGAVVEATVNAVGVDLNTASPELLSYVAGLTPAVSRNIVSHRDQHGPFASRKGLHDVPRLGPKTFEQCAGFLRITDGDHPLDQTPIHPESYAFAANFLSHLGFDIHDMVHSEKRPDLRRSLERLSPEQIQRMAGQIGVGRPTLDDIVQALKRPGRDPREDAAGPELRQDVLTMEDLKEGMTLKGTVRNVVDFGAFVDIGVGQDGLVHISQLSDSFVKHPLDVVSVGMVVDVTVLSIDLERKRIALSMRHTL